MTGCPFVAVIGGHRYPCLSHEGGIPSHHFAAYWPPCEASWCKLPPGHRALHDIPPGRPVFLDAAGQPIAAARLLPLEEVSRG